MITIVTPTYNRAHTLSRLYESLLHQTSYQFEWIVIDDGSNDSTEELLNKFINSNLKFDIFFEKQINSGKHIAVNNGVSKAKYDWIFIVDSDDIVTFDAVETIHDALISCSNEEIAGVCYRKSYFDDSVIGKNFDERYRNFFSYMTPTDASNYFLGDLAYIFRKENMRENNFPSICGENFFPELFIWNKISDAGKIKFFHNKSIYKAEYLEDGYSANFKKILKKNPKSFLIYYKDQLKREVIILKKIKCLIRCIQCHYYICLNTIFL